jgi:hypothetical protein
MAAGPVRAFGLCLAALLAAPAAAAAEPVDPGIRAALSSWYEELGKSGEGRPWMVTAPGFIDSTPPCRHADTGARKLGPRVCTSLPATALRFDYEIGPVRSDSAFARVEVWERGYFYAWAAQRTYERAAATTFVLERGEGDGRWRILAHQSTPQGIPPNRVTDPMPDLRALFYATRGRDRDPAADARAADRAR